MTELTRFERFVMNEDEQKRYLRVSGPVTDIDSVDSEILVYSRMLKAILCVKICLMFSAISLISLCTGTWVLPAFFLIPVLMFFAAALLYFHEADRETLPEIDSKEVSE